MATVSELLREKIKAKMDVAKFFAAFISISTGLIFDKISKIVNIPNASVFNGKGELVTNSSDYVFVILGIFFILSALAFSIAAMGAYDRLLMPVEYWKKPPPPGKLDDTLQCEMVKAWSWLFQPAVFSFFASLLCFLRTLVKENLCYFILWLAPLIAFVVYKLFSNFGIKPSCNNT